MVICIKKRDATEKRSLQWCIDDFDNRILQVEKILNRIRGYYNLEKGTKILEIGAAQGLSLIVLKKRGFNIKGIEPSSDAIQTSKELFRHYKINISLIQSFAEKLPFQDESFEIIIADNVMEHITDIKLALNEINRVLKKNGILYFSTASAMCPMQNEIRFFPFFGWYPDKIKIKLMNWAKKSRPDLIGYTDYPAINWFTPMKAKRLLKRFSNIYFSWDVIRTDEFNGLKRNVSKIIKKNRFFRFISEIFVPGCIYIAKK